MARIRTIKPDAWHDERLAAVSRDARLLWTVLITMADDEGRFRPAPGIIFGHGYPHDQDALALIPEWLSELVAAGLVQVYEVDGGHFGCFPRWLDHQRVSKPTPSKIPGPPGGPEDPQGSPGNSESPRNPNGGGGSQPIPGIPRDSLGSRACEEVEVEVEKDNVEPSRLDHNATARRLFAYWQDHCRHPQAIFGTDRRAKVIARLRDGYSEDQIRLAIDGAARAAYVDERGKRHDDLELICRNSSKLESFIGRAMPVTSSVVEEINDPGRHARFEARRRARAAALANPNPNPDPAA